MIDYEVFRAEQASGREDGRYLGLGISLYVEPTQSGMGILGTEAATVRVDPTGKVDVLMGTTSHGHSLETTMIQVVAEELGCDLEDVSLIQGDTAGTPYGAGTGGSRSAVLGGGAAGLASQQVRETAIEIAAHVLGAESDQLAAENGRIFVIEEPARGPRAGRDRRSSPTWVTTSCRRTSSQDSRPAFATRRPASCGRIAARSAPAKSTRRRASSRSCVGSVSEGPAGG